VRCTSADTGSSALIDSAIFWNNWHFVAVSVNYPNYYFYIDNKNSIVTNTNSYTAANPLGIGYRQWCNIGSGTNNVDPSFSGEMANVQIYNTSLSPSEIQALYQEGIGGAPIDLQHLVAWYPLNGNANDYSGNGNNGVPSNVMFVSNWWSGYMPP
jgi:hypothetical protein